MKGIIQEFWVGKVSIDAKEMVFLNEKNEAYPALKGKGRLRGMFRPMSFKIMQKRVNQIAVEARKDMEKLIIKILKESNVK